MKNNKFFAIFWNAFRDKKISTTIFSLSSALLVWMYVAMYPTIADQAEDFEKAFANYPEGFFKAFGIESLSFDTIEKFLALENYSILWPILVMFMVIAFAGFNLARETETGTAEILLSRPVSRLKIFFARYLAGLMAFVIFNACSVYAIIPLATLHNIDYVIEHHTSIFILNLVFGWAVYSIAMMLSALFSEKGKTYGIAAGVMIIMYVMNLAASLLEKVEGLKYYSFFYYYDFNAALIDNEITWESLGIFISVALACTVFGAYWYNRRDIAV